MKKKLGYSLRKVGYETLSLYTISKYCTDINDVETGIDELKKFIQSNYPANCKLAQRRILSLEKKKLKLNNK
jgi:predicted ATP-dependent Lon-type protease